MAGRDIIAASTAAAGTAQPQRDDARLRPEHAPLDERDTAALLQSLRALAPLIRHHPLDPAQPAGDWTAYFPEGDAAALAALIARADGSVAPHHALLIAFLKLLARPQALLNRYTAEQLQFQMQRVLGFVPRPALPDRAHLVLELKKGATPLAITPAMRFTAGKDASKVEQLFAPVRDTVIGLGQVARLAGIARVGGRLHFAPVANSADGLGAPLAGSLPQWPPFDGSAWPAAPVGFAVASPLLRLAEGERRIQLRLQLAGWPAGLAASDFAAAFEAHLSGPKGWLGPLALNGTLAGDRLTLTVQLADALEPVVDHDPAVHLQPYPAALPVLQCLLKPTAAVSYADLANLQVRRAQVAVRATGLRGLTLENDEAALDPKKAFLPFGVQPVKGSRFHVGCPEALSKRLTSLSIKLAWQGAPPDLYTWYENYSKRSQFSNGVGATLSWIDHSGATHHSGTVALLPRLAGPTTLMIDGAGSASASSPAAQLQALQWSGSAVAQTLAGSLGLAQPVWMMALPLAVGFAGSFASPPKAATPRAGFVTVALVEDLLHGDFRRESLLLSTPPTLGATDFAPKFLNEPYTPKVQEITLDYEAASDDSRLDDPSTAAFTDTELQFFQVDALGPAREHRWLAAARPWAPQGGITLLPPHVDAGELLIGLQGLAAGDSVSLLLQVAEGSADPLASAQTLRWSVLADNVWRELGPGELALDTTRQLRRSGLIEAVLPRETTSTNTRAPAGLVWLRAAIPAQPRAACNVVGVFPNAIEVLFADQGNDPLRLASALPAGSITKMKASPAALKGVAQPYASFGGALMEDDAALARRAAERLRHRQRAVTAWDIERLVLQAFPSVWRAKCIPHASESSWLAAGHVSVIVVPDLHASNAGDPLQPRVDLDTLTQIHAHLAARGAPQTQWHVRNPAYRAVLCDFKLRLRPGFGFNFYAPQTDLALRQALAPWAFDGGAPLGFGGSVLRSALLDLVEALPWVDFVTDFRLTLEGSEEDRDEIVPDAPDVILVSAAAHRIAELIDG
jgi:hypothetical protein